MVAPNITSAPHGCDRCRAGLRRCAVSYMSSRRSPITRYALRSESRIHGQPVRRIARHHRIPTERRSDEDLGILTLPRPPCCRRTPPPTSAFRSASMRRADTAGSTSTTIRTRADNQELIIYVPSAVSVYQRRSTCTCRRRSRPTGAVMQRYRAAATGRLRGGELVRDEYLANTTTAMATRRRATTGLRRWHGQSRGRDKRDDRSDPFALLTPRGGATTGS